MSLLIINIKNKTEVEGHSNLKKKKKKTFYEQEKKTYASCTKNTLRQFKYIVSQVFKYSKKHVDASKNDNLLKLKIDIMD